VEGLGGCAIEEMVLGRVEDRRGETVVFGMHMQGREEGGQSIYEYDTFKVEFLEGGGF